MNKYYPEPPALSFPSQSVYQLQTFSPLVISRYRGQHAYELTARQLTVLRLGRGPYRLYTLCTGTVDTTWLLPAGKILAGGFQLRHEVRLRKSGTHLPGGVLGAATGDLLLVYPRRNGPGAQLLLVPFDPALLSEYRRRFPTSSDWTESLSRLQT